MAKKNTKKDATNKSKKENNKKTEKKVAIKNDSLENALDELVEEETTWVEAPKQEELEEVLVPFMQVIDEVETSEDVPTTIKHSTTIVEEISTTASTIEITTEDVIEEVITEEKPLKRRFKYESNGSCDDLPLIAATPYKKNHKKIRLNFED